MLSELALAKSFVLIILDSVYSDAWMEAREREYTYLSMFGHYLKFFDVFCSIFYRTFWQAGITEPRKFATDENREFLLNSYRELKQCPGLHECFSCLRRIDFMGVMRVILSVLSI
jgi:2-haloacid dehalogenase